MRLTLVPLIVAGSLASMPASSAKCPVQSAADTMRVLTEAKTCREANRVLRLCSWSSSMDIQFAEVVVEKCEKDFYANSSDARRATYSRDREECDTKFAGRAGTIYFSRATLCRARVAAKYSGR